MRMDYCVDRRNGGDREKGKAAGGGQSVIGSRFGNWFYCSQKGVELYWILRTLLDKAVRRFKISAKRYYTANRHAETVYKGQNEDLGGTTEGGSGPSSSWSPLSSHCTLSVHNGQLCGQREGGRHDV